MIICLPLLCLCTEAEISSYAKAIPINNRKMSHSSRFNRNFAHNSLGEKPSAPLSLLTANNLGGGLFLWKAWKEWACGNSTVRRITCRQPNGESRRLQLESSVCSTDWTPHWFRNGDNYRVHWCVLTHRQQPSQPLSSQAHEEKENTEEGKAAQYNPPHSDDWIWHINQKCLLTIDFSGK